MREPTINDKTAEFGAGDYDDLGLKNFAPVPDLRWFFVDFNSYFASVEQYLNPDLLGKPVAVVPSVTDQTCAIAASYEAKRFGIKTGTKIHEAKQLCPQLVCVLARHDEYVRLHHEIFSMIETILHVDKICSIDEAACRLFVGERDEISARAISMEIKKALYDRYGSAITCSIGLAPTKLLAKIAADYQKPDGLTVFKPNHYQYQLFKLALSDLPGIGANMQKRLFRAGVFSIEKFWNLSPKHARKIWKSVEGERFWFKLRGYDIPDLETSKRVIGHSRVLDPDAREDHKAYEIIRYLTMKAALRLRKAEHFAGALDLKVKLSYDSQWGEMRWGTSTTFAKTQDDFKILTVLDDLWQRFNQIYGRTRVAKVSISLHDLTPANQINYDLFDSEPTLQPQKKSLTNLIDKVNDRYGKNTVSLGLPPKTSAGHLGTKIAFGRIPDLSE